MTEVHFGLDSVESLVGNTQKKSGIVGVLRNRGEGEKHKIKPSCATRRMTQERDLGANIVWCITERVIQDLRAA